MDGPLPSWLVGRAANGQASEVNDFELPFFKRAGFVRSFESLQHYFEWGHRSASLPMFGVGARFAGSAWGPSARAQFPVFSMTLAYVVKARSGKYCRYRWYIR